MKTFFFLAFLVLTSCGGGSKSKAQNLGKLRVLALVADKPEVQPGNTVQISPLVSFFNLSSQSLTHEAWGCLDPGIAYGAVPNCDTSADRVNLMASTSLSLSGPNYTESISNLFSVAIPATTLDPYDSVTRYNGVSYIVEYTVKSSDGQSVRSIRRIKVTDKALSEWNSNPTLTNIMATTGSAISSLPTKTTGLFPNFPGTAKQAYTLKDSSGTLKSSTESVTASWFVTQGSFDYDRTDSTAVNNFFPDGKGSTGTVTLVVVLHDNRGGSAVSINNL